MACDDVCERPMNLRLIEAFVWVARLRSFAAAAKRL
jgi:DNA-binding transcriptional LysR family regulator